MAMGCVVGEKMLRADSAERAAAYDYDVKHPCVWTLCRICAGFRFIQTVTNVSSENIFAERGELCSSWGRHSKTPFMWLGHGTGEWTSGRYHSRWLTCFLQLAVNQRGKVAIHRI